jgi:RsiW-degrading membrane proteinase PrsW (M82 family)
MTIIIAITLIALLVIAMIKMKKGKMKPNYRVLFILGIAFLPIGITQLIRESEPFFFILSMVYIAIGLVNKGKWEQPQQITEKQKKVLIMSVLAGVLLLILGIIIFLIVK